MKGLDDYHLELDMILLFRLKLSGKIHVCAFLHSKATVKEATLALKQDILRSLRGRLEMHCDSLISNEATDSGHEEVRQEQPPVIQTCSKQSLSASTGRP